MPKRKDWKIRYIGFVEIPRKAIRKNGKLFLVRDYSVCWEWSGGKYDSRGYGGFWKDGKTQSATRVGWLYWNGAEVPKELLVCHTCDNPSCHNPRHWFLGSVSDNTVDKIKKGRANLPNGSAQWSSKLTEEQVLAIRAEHSGAYGENARLGRKFGVSRETIRGIINGKEWHHLLN